MVSSTSIFRPEGPQRWQPKDYQDRALRFLLGQRAAGLFLDPGMGKTSITYAAISVLREREDITCALVVAPLRPVYLVWPQERDKWLNFNHLRLEILHGDHKDQAIQRPADVYLINPEGLQWLFDLNPSWLDGAMVTFDESTKFKNSQSKRFKLVRKQLPRFRRRVILTGTPRANGLEDLFGQVYLLDQGNSLGRYITHFRTAWFYPTGYQGRDWQPKPGAEREIYERIAPLVMRLNAEEEERLPELVDVPPIEVELPSEARRVYDELERDFIAELESGEVVAANAAAKTAKLRQIANGGVYRSSDRGDFEHFHHAKADAVADLVEELGGRPTMVAYDTKHDLDRLRSRLGKGTPYLGGGVSAKRGKELEAAWNRGELPVLLVQPESVAHGLNLQDAGDALIWHSLTYDYETYDQLIRRLWRQGRKERVRRYHVVARNTLDAAVYASLGRKARGQNEFFEALREYYLEGSLSKGFTTQPEKGRVSSVIHDEPQGGDTMSEVQFTEGQRVRLLPNEEEGLPEEFGYIEDMGLNQNEEEVIIVRVDDEYRDASDPEDDGRREVDDPEEVEVVEGVHEAEPTQTTQAYTASAYVLDPENLTVVGRYEDVKRAEEVAGDTLTVLPEDEQGFGRVLKRFSSADLVTLHNGIVGSDHAVSKFKSKADAIKKVRAALETHGGEAEEGRAERSIEDQQKEKKVSEKKSGDKQSKSNSNQAKSDDKQSKSDGQQTKSGGKKAKSDGQQPKSNGQQPKSNGQQPKSGNSKRVKVDPMDIEPHLPKTFPKPEDDEKTGAYIRRLLKLETYSDEVICAAAVKHFGGKTKVKDVQWNRSKLRKDGDGDFERLQFGDGKGEKQLAKRAEIELEG